MRAFQVKEGAGLALAAVRDVDAAVPERGRLRWRLPVREAIQ